MPLVHVSCPQQIVPQAHVGQVILVLNLEILFALDVVTADPIHEQAVRDPLQVVFHCAGRDLPPGTGHGICHFFQGTEIADVIKQEAQNTFQH